MSTTVSALAARALVHRRQAVIRFGYACERLHPASSETRDDVGMPGTRPSPAADGLTVEYLEAEASAEGLPDEYSASRLRRSLLTLGAMVLGVGSVIVWVPGLASLRDRFAGAQPGCVILGAGLQLGTCARYVLVFRGVF